MAKAAVGAARINMSINSAEFGRQLERMDNATKRWQRSLRNTERTFKRTGRNLERTGRRWMRITGVIAGAATGIVALQKRTGEYADQLLDLEQITGMNTRALQEWRNVARAAGVETDAMSNAVEGLGRRIRGISDESGAAHEAAEKLGVNFKDANGELRDTDEVMTEAIARLSEMEPGLERAGLAGDLFGRRWQHIAPVLGLTGREIQRLRDDAQNLEGFMSGEALRAANQFRQEMAQLQERFAGLGREIAMDLLPLVREELLPLLETMIESVGTLTSRFAELDTEVQKNVLKYVALAAAIAPVVWGVGKLVGLAGTLIGVFRKVVAVKASSLVVFGKVAAAIGGIVSVIASVAVVAQNLVENWEVSMAEFQLIWAKAVHGVSRGGVEIAKAMNAIGLLSDKNFTKMSQASAKARFEMLNAQRTFDDLYDSKTSLSESAENLMNKLRGLGQSAWDSTLRFLGLRSAVDEVRESIDSVGLDGEMFSASMNIDPPNFEPVKTAFSSARDFIEGTIDGMQSRWGKFTNAMKEMGTDFQRFLAQELTQAVLSFGQALGQSLAGAENQWQTTFEKIMLVVVDFAESLARLGAAIGGLLVFIPGMQAAGAGMLAASAALMAATTYARSSIQQRGNERQQAAQETRVNDALIRSDGSLVHLNPNDDILAMQDFSNLAPAVAGGGGGSNMGGGKSYLPIQLQIGTRTVVEEIVELMERKNR